MDQAAHQRFEMMVELVVFVRLHVHRLVISQLQFDGTGRPIGRLAPFADAHAQVRLHVEGVRDARRRCDIRFGELPAERRSFDVLEVVHQFMAGARMDRIEPKQRFVEDGRFVAAVDLRACEPAFFVVIVKRQQFVERCRGFLLALVGTDAGDHALFLQLGLDNQALALTGLGHQLFGLFECLRRVAPAVFFQCAVQDEPCIRAIRVVSQAVSAERAASIQTYE